MARPNLGGDAARFRSDVASAIAKCYQRGMDLELAGGRLILTSADGTAYYLAADDTGVLFLVDLLTGTPQALPATAADIAALDTRLDALEASPIRLQAHRATSSQSLTVGGATVLVFNVEDRDTDSAYNNTTGVYTAPATGDYEIVVNVGVFFSAAPTVCHVGILHNGTYKAVQSLPVYGGDSCYGSVSLFIPLTAGDTITAQIAISSGTSPVLTAQPWCNITVRKH